MMIATSSPVTSPPPLRRLALAVALGLPLPVLAQAGAIPQGDGPLTEYVATALRQRLGDVPVRVTAPLVIRMGPNTVSLKRLSDACRLQPGNCAANVAMFVQGNVEMQKSAGAPLDPKALRLIVRTRASIGHSETQDPSIHDVELEDLPGDLVTVAVVDTPNSVLFARTRQLAPAGLTHDQLFARARDNMRKEVQPSLDKVPPAATGDILNLQGNFYVSGLVGMPTDWAPLAEAQHGTLVIALPATDIVLYMSSAEPQALKALAENSRQIAANVANPLAPGLLLRWQDGRWEQQRVDGNPSP